MARKQRYRLGVGELMGRSVWICLRNLVPFLVLGLLVMVPWWAAYLWFYLDGAVFDMPWLGLLIALLKLTFGFMLTGATAYGVVMGLRGEPKGMVASVMHGVGLFFSVLRTSLSCALRIVLWSLLLWIPGILETIRLYVAIPVAAMEGESGGRAADRSQRLTNGQGWPLFSVWLLVLVLDQAGQFMLGFIAVSYRGGFHSDEGIWALIGYVVLGVLLQVFASTTMSVAYFMLRSGKENVDARAVAKVFD